MIIYLIAGIPEDIVKGLLDGLGKAVFGILLPILDFISSWINDFFCMLIDIIASILPSTPSALQISSLLASILKDMPFGKSLIIEIFSMISTFLMIILAVKVYKLIPYKMS